MFAKRTKEFRRNFGFPFSVDLTQILISLLSEFKIHFWHFAVWKFWQICRRGEAGSAFRHCIPHWREAATLPHYHTATLHLPHCHTSTLPRCHIATLPHCHTAFHAEEKCLHSTPVAVASTKCLTDTEGFKFRAAFTLPFTRLIQLWEKCLLWTNLLPQPCLFSYWMNMSLNWIEFYQQIEEKKLKEWNFVNNKLQLIHFLSTKNMKIYTFL